MISKTNVKTNRRTVKLQLPVHFLALHIGCRNHRPGAENQSANNAGFAFLSILQVDAKSPVKSMPSTRSGEI